MTDGRRVVAGPAAAYTRCMGIRAMLDRLLGRSQSEPASTPPPDPDLHEPEENLESIEERLDEIRADQTFYTG
jgi:hypothetical protein